MQRSRIIPVTFIHPPARHSSRLGQRFQLALGAAAALAAISLSPGSAQALVVTVDGVQYDVTASTFTPNNNGNASKFETPADGGMMPWYGNSQLAIDFATTVGGVFGNRLVYATNYNPNNLDGLNVAGIFWSTAYAPANYTGGATYGKGDEMYALATALPAPAPGPLPLFGAAAAFGFSRKLRKRIKLEPVVLGSSRPQA